MAAAETLKAHSNPGRMWLILGVLLLMYAVLGNWLVLPGYKRFLEHGSPNAGNAGIDFVLIWGATRTILWMFSFHLGAFCLAFAALSAHGHEIRVFRRWFSVAVLIWIMVWGIPTLPGPYTAYFATVGSAILAMIIAFFARATFNAAREGSYFHSFRGGHWQVASYFFFAIATWDMCGLGSVGGILRPADEIRAASQSLVVAQTTKLIVELAVAWGLLAVASFSGRAGGLRSVHLPP